MNRSVLLIIMLGTNDAKERFGSNAACIALGMKRLIQKAQSVKDCWADGKPNILLITPQNMDARYIDSPFTASMGRGCVPKRLRRWLQNTKLWQN